MDEEPSESRDVQESLQEVKVELARKRLRLLQEEVTELKVQINSYKEDGEVVDLTKDEEDDTIKDPDYEKVVLYRHKTTGYYYDPNTGQFHTLISHQTSQVGQASQTSSQASIQAGQTNQGVIADTSGENKDENSTQKLLDSIAEVSDKASQQCGFVYDADSGLYYDVQSGMYYDQESQLYYNPQFGAYFYYDSEEGQYKIHCLAEMSGTEDTVGVAAPPESQWDRCIRLIVKESHKLQPGCLYVVTKEGLQLGREVSDPRSIQIPELEVSKVHAEITFDNDEDLFFITDLGSRNGTHLNENMLSEPKEKSKPQPLSHGDHLRLGATTFVVHFHVGTETCEQCEPGLLQQSPMINCSEQIYSSSKRSIAGQRRNELQRLKKKYGLIKGNSAGSDPHRESSYVDRAALRYVNKFVGLLELEVSWLCRPISCTVWRLF
ncbi:angiogenic factor with G patch and FHA domains 1-like isoform X2 [Dysidea avara]|uniref:angiogenic factor with G patch and FHA domains 1-like isoform X2 n=1 Tax=Dysidea avara TaxID=196820 RepID=UPI00332DDFE0